MTKLTIFVLLGLASTLSAAPAKENSTKPAPTIVTVALAGDVGKPGLYEIKAGADLRSVMGLAGGLAIRPNAARIIIERGPNKKLSFPASVVFNAKAKQSFSVQLQENDYIRVDALKLKRSDPIMAFIVPEAQANTAGLVPRAFEFNGITVYMLPLPGPERQKK